MAFSGNFVCSQFKQDLLKGRHDFTTSTGDTFKLSLHTNSATPMDATLTAYTTSGEVAATGGYSTGGGDLAIETGMPGLTTGTAFADFVDETWSSSTITARGAVLYNSTPTSGTNLAVLVLDFGSDKTSSAGDFTVQFPAGVAATAIIRIA